MKCLGMNFLFQIVNCSPSKPNYFTARYTADADLSVNRGTLKMSVRVCKNLILLKFYFKFKIYSRKS